MIKSHRFKTDRKLKIYMIQTSITLIIFDYVLLNLGATLIQFTKHRKTPIGTLLHGGEWDHYLLNLFDLHNKIAQYTWILFFSLFVITLIPIFRRFQSERKQYEQREDYASHGTARWMTKEEVKAFYHRTQKGILLGSYDKTQYWPIPLAPDGSVKEDLNRPADAPREFAVHPFDDKLNNQSLIIGPPGSDKTTGFVLPNVIHQIDLGSSIVVTDPKGEVYKLTANYAKKKGYAVRVLDYIYFSYGDRLNSLNYIRSETDMKTIANVYMQGSKAKDEKDDFWANKAQSLLMALIGYVLAVKGSKGSWPDVYDALVHPTLLDPEEGPALISKVGLRGLAKTEYQAFIRGTDEVREGVIATLSSRLQNYGIQDVRIQSQETDFDLYKIGYEKTILYVWISDSNTAFRGQSSVFFTTFFNAQYEAARHTNDKLGLTVVPILEEMANIGQIGDYLTKLTTMRGRGLKPIHIWHNLPQLAEVYGKNQAAAFMGACDTTIVLGNNDLETAKTISELIGDTTIRVQSQSEKTTSLSMGNENQSYQGRRLMQVSELRSMDTAFTLVLQRGRQPVMLKKAQYRYWERVICEEATLSDLVQYGRGNNLTKEVDYSFVRGTDDEIAATEAQRVDEKNDAALDLLDNMLQTDNDEENEE